MTDQPSTAGQRVSDEHLALMVKHWAGLPHLDATKLAFDLAETRAALAAERQQHAEEIARLTAERDQAHAEAKRLDALINMPHTGDWLEAVRLEAAHQRERYVPEHDARKTPFDWFWLIGFLAQKAAAAAVSGDQRKTKHHTISTGAVLLNWFRHVEESAHPAVPNAGEAP